jgi:hypothetical protein
MSTQDMPGVQPLSDEALASLRRLTAELAAGHPQYGDQDYDDLLRWQKEMVSMWALNLQSCGFGSVPGLLARLDAAEAERDELRHRAQAAEDVARELRRHRDALERKLAPSSTDEPGVADA